MDGRAAETALAELAGWITKTFELNPYRPELPLGYFANVVRVSDDLAFAISTDGVGTKILLAEQLDRYDTIGIDCVAMNANDIICVGARPISMVDYLALESADPSFLGEIGAGLYEGARRAGINIPGGELAQVREMIRGCRKGRAFDLVGTCVGTVHPDRVLVGEAVEPGDIVVGIASSGVHSNGLTLARQVLLAQGGLDLDANVADLTRTLGEELLEPTHIYVAEAMAMLDRGLAVKAFAHITSDGLLNLLRVKNRQVGYVIDRLLQVPPIFALIQELGSVEDAEMFSVYNMGTGFCVVVRADHADRAIKIAGEHGHKARVIGYVVEDPERRVWVPERKLVGKDGTFRASGQPVPARPPGGSTQGRPST